MNIYNRKGFLLGIIWLILGAMMFIIKIRIPEDTLMGRIKDIGVAAVLMMLGVVSMTRSLSKKATREDQVEAMDERNHLIETKTKAKTLDILLGLIVIFIIAGMIGYMWSGNHAWGLFVLVPAILIGVYWVTYLLVYLYYERHE